MSRVLLCSVLTLSIAAHAAAADKAPPKKPQDGPPAVKAKGPEFKPRYVPGRPPLQPRAVKPVPTKRLVYSVKNLPATDLAKTVNEFLLDEAQAQIQPLRNRVVIVPEPITNSLLVSAPTDELDELGDLIRELDDDPGMVLIQVWIASVTLDEDLAEGYTDLITKPQGANLERVLAELKEHGQLRILSRPAVTTLDNQPAFINVGQRQPRVTGRSTSSRGMTNTVSMENVGLVLGLTPRIDSRGVVTMEIDVEQSYMGPPEEGAAIASSPDGEVIRTPNIETMSLQTTVSAASGEIVVLGGLLTKDDSKSDKCRGTLVLLVPRVLD